VTEVQKIVDMVKSGPTTLRVSYPEIGLQILPGPVLSAMVDGPRLAFVSLDPGSQLKVFSEFLLGVSEIGDTIVAEGSGENTKKLLTFVRTTPWGNDDLIGDSAEDMYISSKEDFPARMQEAIGRLSEPVKPVLDYKIDYVEWATIDDTGVHPAGLIVLSADGEKLIGVPFPGYESEAGRWDRWESVLPGLLAELDSRIGRTDTASEPMEMRGVNLADACERALFHYATKYYMTTKRSPYQ
jgi:hypothetical protein